MERVFSRIDRHIRGTMSSRGIPGLAIALTDADRTLWVGTYGHADISARTPVRNDTLFQIGSISKSFASMVILQMQEKGLLKIDDPISRHLPWLRIKSRYGPITLKHLMSHSGGIMVGTDFTLSGYSEAKALNETAVDIRPGSFFHYSNSGYKVLGLVIEEILGTDNGSAIEERILRPLGMKASKGSITNDLREATATGYAPVFDDRPAPVRCPLAPAPWIESFTADGSITSTAPDMAKYVRMLLNRGRGPAGRILSEHSFSSMIENVVHPNDAPPSDGYGLGLDIMQKDGHLVIGHSGGMLGFVSYIEADMDAGFGLAAFTNVSRASYRPEDLVRLAATSIRAAIEGRPMPKLPEDYDANQVENAKDYAGTYRSGGRTLRVRARRQRLFLEHDSHIVPMERLEKDSFYADSDGFELFPLRFGRDKDEVVEVFHGSDWYYGQPYKGRKSFRTPKAWDSYVGHYRTYNPWYSNFRVVVRKGELALTRPDGSEEMLTPLKAGWFRVGTDKRSPERIRFDVLYGGKAMRATMPGSEWWRTAAP